MKKNSPSLRLQIFCVLCYIITNVKYCDSAELSKDGKTVVRSCEKKLELFRLTYSDSDIGSWDKLGNNIITEALSVDLSSDGNILAYASKDLIRVLQYKNDDWYQIGNDILSSSASSVMLSGDGTIMSIDSDNGIAVYEYISPSNTWEKMGSDLEEIYGLLSLSDNGHNLVASTSRSMGSGIQMFEYSIDDNDWVKVGDLYSTEGDDYSYENVQLVRGNQKATNDTISVGIFGIGDSAGGNNDTQWPDLGFFARIVKFQYIFENGERNGGNWTQVGERVFFGDFYDLFLQNGDVSNDGQLLVLFGQDLHSPYRFVSRYDDDTASWIQVNPDYDPNEFNPYSLSVTSFMDNETSEMKYHYLSDDRNLFAKHLEVGEINIDGEWNQVGGKCKRYGINTPKNVLWNIWDV